MKRVGNLYSKIYEKSNIHKAMNKASLRKKNRENVKKILNNQIYYTDLLYKLLKNKEYKPNPYREKKYMTVLEKKKEQYINLNFIQIKLFIGL